MSMLSFYGGPAGKSFTITKIFTSKSGTENSLDVDLAAGVASDVYEGDYVLISYGDPNSTDFKENQGKDNDAWNGTLWQKVWQKAENESYEYAYNLICTNVATYPLFAEDGEIITAAFGTTPSLKINSDTVAKPKAILTLPASLVAGTNNTITVIRPTDTPEFSPKYEGEEYGNELSFDVKIPQGVTFTPKVSEDSIISWTNDGGLDNPTPVNIKGLKGDTGTSFAGIEYIPSFESGGNNTFKIKFSDGTTGTEEYIIKNGIGIVDVKEVPSSEDGGDNSITFIKSDKSEIGPIAIKNGSKGSTGAINSITATIDENVGTPEVNAELSGNPSNADITFEFKNLKGRPGTIQSVTATVDSTSIDEGNPACKVTEGGTPEDRTFSLAFSHLVGKRGLTGYYFTPTVNTNGDLSWSNNGGLDSPATQNIRGPKGEGGTVQITSIAVDNGSSEIATPYAEAISETIDPQNAKYRLEFHNLVGKTGPQGLRGYYYLPAVDTEGNLSWTNNSNGEIPTPTTQNIRGPQGKTGNPLNIIAMETITANEVAEDTLAAVGTELTTRGYDPTSDQLIAVSYVKTEGDTVSYWYFKINRAWQRVQLSGGMDSIVVNDKVQDDTASFKVYSAAYINALEARLAVLENALTIGYLKEGN